MITTKRTERFLHSFIPMDNLETTEIDGKRHYITPDGTFPSVTTVLGEKLSKGGLEEWRARVGEKEAARITKLATDRGTAVHSICERYVLNQEYRSGVMPTDMHAFLQIKPYLDLNLGSIYGIEAPLYSRRLRTAGRCDLLAGWQGVNSIIDFKTSRRLKKEEYIESYFLQATCYSLMAEERTLLKFPQIVIVIAVDHEDPQIFVKQRDQYVEKVLEIFQ
jgi:genome maintenance exonuclease 1